MMIEATGEKIPIEGHPGPQSMGNLASFDQQAGQAVPADSITVPHNAKDIVMPDIDLTDFDLTRPPHSHEKITVHIDDEPIVLTVHQYAMFKHMVQNPNTPVFSEDFRLAGMNFGETSVRHKAVFGEQMRKLFDKFNTGEEPLLAKKKTDNRHCYIYLDGNIDPSDIEPPIRNGHSKVSILGATLVLNPKEMTLLRIFLTFPGKDINSEVFQRYGAIFGKTPDNQRSLFGNSMRDLIAKIEKVGLENLIRVEGVNRLTRYKIRIDEWKIPGGLALTEQEQQQARANYKPFVRLPRGVLPRRAPKPPTRRKPSYKKVTPEIEAPTKPAIPPPPKKTLKLPPTLSETVVGQIESIIGAQGTEGSPNSTITDSLNQLTDMILNRPEKLLKHGDPGKSLVKLIHGLKTDLADRCIAGSEKQALAKGIEAYLGLKKNLIFDTVLKSPASQMDDTTVSRREALVVAEQAYIAGLLTIKPSDMDTNPDAICLSLMKQALNELHGRQLKLLEIGVVLGPSPDQKPNTYSQ
jgi:hypothetical protein